MSAEGDTPSFDFEMAWDMPIAYALIRESAMALLAAQPEYNPEYPYDELTKVMTTTAMIADAHEHDRKIEVRYDWESLDESNLILHSAEGWVEDPAIIVNGTSQGFLLRTIDGEQETFMAFDYTQVFWVCAAPKGK